MPATIPDSRTDAGQRVYTPLVLRAYDLFVLGLSNHAIWRCPTARLRSLYDRNVTDSHLDVGVGTGYFLDKAAWPTAQPDVTLLDLNPHSLAAAARRIARLRPVTVQADILQPLPAMGPFRSVGLCYLLHCLPGPMAEKAVVFDHLRPVLAEGARVFGATLVQGDAPRSFAARRLMGLYNRKGVFCNAADTVDALEAALRARFVDVAVRLVGTVAVFEAAFRGQASTS